ncbi:tubby like protein 6 [Actinidia rufa]|uniref:Tubby like protein 6 n=1 Tax=Actinidia rufa TaxID=165716 RepID=A0A7J0GHQ9_9ERIC|nr:tubby like protein 6 [Actinidia rufa]
MRDGSKNKSRRRADRKCVHGRGRSHIAPERSPSPSALVKESRWANLPPELLLDIIQRLEASQNSWPARRDVVACAAACRSWRETTKEVVRAPEQCGLLTFPISLKQVDPQDTASQSLPYSLNIVLVSAFYIVNWCSLFLCHYNS